VSHLAWHVVGLAALSLQAACGTGIGEPPPVAPPGHTVDLARAFAAKKLRGVNREITRIHPTAVRLSSASDTGLAWIEGTNLSTGSIQVDVRGRGGVELSYVGLAFHRKDDETYEAVYLRPFNFGTSDPMRRQHAVQYIQVPEHDFDSLRRDFPEEFENPVDASLNPSAWVRLRVVIGIDSVQIYVGPAMRPALDVRKLGRLYDGQVGLWVGNGSDGDFANLVVASN
jgi:hypothetical protein